MSKAIDRMAALETVKLALLERMVVSARNMVRYHGDLISENRYRGRMLAYEEAYEIITSTLTKDLMGDDDD